MSAAIIKPPEQVSQTRFSCAVRGSRVASKLSLSTNARLSLDVSSGSPDIHQLIKKIALATIGVPSIRVDVCKKERESWNRHECGGVRNLLGGKFGDKEVSGPIHEVPLSVVETKSVGSSGKRNL